MLEDQQHIEEQRKKSLEQRERLNVIKTIIKNGKVPPKDQRILREYYDKYFSETIGDPKIKLKNITKFKVEEYQPVGNEVHWKSSKCIYLYHRKFGREIKKAISSRNLAGYKRTIRYEIKKLFRLAIEPYVDLHRCYGLHVDHVYPFAKIIEDFMQKNGYTYDYLKIMKHNDQLHTDSYIVQQFINYHNNVVDYQLLTPEANQLKGCKLPKNLSGE